MTRLKTMFRYDDSLDVFGVHCIGSIVGMSMLGWLASAEVNPAIASTFKVGDQVVSLAGGAAQFLNQLQAVLFTVVLASAVTFVLLKAIDAAIGLRVAAEQEHAGLDISEHGESAYN